ncbi:Alw26I/Eco31I/Esp3I family type II restriction adenine-specific DNA-methyltransferase [Sinorhizobium sp. B11]
MNLVVNLRDITDGSGAFSRKSLHERYTGKFYTPDFISELVAIDLAGARKKKTTRSLVDPFAGDGRLVVKFLSNANASLRGQHLNISLWDCDESALKLAEKNVKVALQKHGLTADIDVRAGDSFHLASSHHGTFDLCITNPPWEALKPDRRELRLLSSSKQAQVIEHLRRFDADLASMYPMSQPSRKFSGWGTNLSRVGTELAVKLVRQGGSVGIICPAALFADQNSEKLREWLWQDLDIRTMSFFPAEARLFDRVDQSCLYFTANRGTPSKDIELSIFNNDLSLKERSHVAVERLKARPGQTIPFELGHGALALFETFLHHETFKELEGHPDGLWAGRELDETGYQNFLARSGEYHFIKGRMIGQYAVHNPPNSYVSTSGPIIPSSANFQRIAWRDVSRPTQKRRVQATIIPGGWVTGNSLHVAYFRDGDISKLRRLLAIMNSLVFELQARAVLSTSHVSLGVIRQVRVPALSGLCLIDTLCERRLAGDAAVEDLLEVACAKAYGFDRSNFSKILEFFKWIPEKKREFLMSKSAWAKI